MRHLRVFLAVGLVAGGVLLVFAAAPASAGLGLACPASTSTPFAGFGDRAHYAYLPDGGFENGAAGWKLSSGARVVAGNEPFYVHHRGDAHALSVPKGGMATSPGMCISLLSSKMRFVATGQGSAKGQAGKVKVQIVYHGLLSSVLGILDGGTISANGQWQPSPEVGMLGGVLPLLTSSVQFRFVGTDGTVRIDDVYLDPMKSA
ncbi:MAG TPA: hypothetical protein VH306_14600 [Gaiellaceae bacterium]